MSRKPPSLTAILVAALLLVLALAAAQSVRDIFWPVPSQVIYVVRG